MDLEKHGDSSDASEKRDEDNAGVGRSYECAFCKRGFTNAQALGGHMNIHRKDKAKAKQKSQEETSSAKPNPRFTPPQPPHQRAAQTQVQVQVQTQMNYQVYLPLPNPSFQFGNYLPLWTPDHLDDADLRLRPADHGGDRGNVEEKQVDLELRLGHDP